ncbi:MAG: hypothetical protein K8S13_12785 [Desulfobacula sp.]|nr:hypothetical protein [Desulfobacula sp.]
MPLSEDIFSVPFVGIEVEIYNLDEATWEILTPRQRLISTAYAFHADNADTLDGIDSTAFLSADEGMVDLDLNNLMVQGLGSFDATGEEGTIYLGDYGNYIKAVYDYGVRIGAYNAEDALVIQQETGNVGIGTINPISKLEISDENKAVSYYSSAYGDSQFSSPMYVGRKARGTSTAPTAVHEHDLLNYFGGKGYGGTSWGSGSNAGISLLASENFNDTSKGTKIYFFTTPNGSTLKWSRMVISNEGNVGIGTEVPSKKLEVAGNIKVTGNDNGIIFPDGSAQMSAGHSQAYVNALETRIASLESKIAALETLLTNVTRNDNDITFSGVNVHVVNGTGTTDGTNGLGNLIVGYNESRPVPDPNDRTGSHNIVVGAKQNYSSYGGLVAGMKNTISGPYASVSGGEGNHAMGTYSSVSGGYNNATGGIHTSVSGGQGNHAMETYSSVSGGYGNVASGSSSSISGGYSNVASGTSSSISGGGNNETSGDGASISGGGNNETSGNTASISGGSYNKASGDYSFVGGGGGYTIYVGNEGNQAFGNYSAILGGKSNISGDPALTNHYMGNASTVSGGWNNIAIGGTSSISGGRDNTATTNHASVSGGQFNEASGSSSSVSGGFENTASGPSSSVSGGYNRSVSDFNNWQAGDLFQDD